jgi:hypothetical protein
LKLRPAVAAGPGFQLLDRGDLGGIFKDMTLWTETGAAYFNEDFTLADDKSSARGRWAVKWDWPSGAAIRQSVSLSGGLPIAGECKGSLPDGGHRLATQSLGWTGEWVPVDQAV